MKPIALVTVKIRLRNSASGRIGSAALALDEHEGDEQRDAEHREPDDLRRAPRPGRAAEAREEHDRREAAGEQRGAEVVDPVPDVRGARVERGGDHDERERRRAAG